MAIARWAAVFMALAVTCLLSLIPMKVPALNPFWQQGVLLPPAMTLLADSNEGLQIKASNENLGSREVQPMLAPLDPRVPLPWSTGFDSPHRGGHFASLYAGIPANPRIPAKKVRRIALPPPTPVNLRAPPSARDASSRLV